MPICRPPLGEPRLMPSCRSLLGKPELMPSCRSPLGELELMPSCCSLFCLLGELGEHGLIPIYCPQMA